MLKMRFFLSHFPCKTSTNFDMELLVLQTTVLGMLFTSNWKAPRAMKAQQKILENIIYKGRKHHPKLRVFSYILLLR